MCNRAGNYQGPHDTMSSRYLGADTICIAILTIPYVMRFDTVISLRFDVLNILISHGNKSTENKWASDLRTSYEGKVLALWCSYSKLAQK